MPKDQRRVTNDGVATLKILHIDMDAFFAAVEVLDCPALKGRPVIVGSRPDERGAGRTKG